MTDYLEQAANLLAKSAEDNERLPTSNEIQRRDKNVGRERIAMKYAQLAAIERGLIPAEMVGDLLAEIVRAPR